jgi:hypothetical protein
MFELGSKNWSYETTYHLNQVQKTKYLGNLLQAS